MATASQVYLDFNASSPVAPEVVDAMTPLDRLDGVAASTGSACHTGTHTMSPVLAAMGVDEEVGLGAIRFSLGRPTTRDEIDTVVERLKLTVG